MTKEDLKASLRAIEYDILDSFEQYEDVAKDPNCIPSEHQYIAYKYLKQKNELFNHIVSEAFDSVYHKHDTVYTRHLSERSAL